MSRHLARVAEARRARLERTDAGISLPELLVTVMLVGLIMTLLVSFMTSVSRSMTRDEAATDSTTVAALAMNNMTRVIRAGTELRLHGAGSNNVPVFVTARPEELTLYAYIDTDSMAPRPLKVRYWIDAERRLIETRWEASNTTSPWMFPAMSSPTSSRTIARSIPVDADPVFTYLRDDGSTMPTPGPGGFTTTQLQQIVAVQITLTVQTDVTERAAPVTVRNAVSIPNLGISRVGPTP